MTIRNEPGCSTFVGQLTLARYLAIDIPGKLKYSPLR